MFSNSNGSSPAKDAEDSASPNVAESPKVPHITIPTDTSNSGEKRANGNSSPGGRKAGDEPGGEKKRRSSGVAKARDMFATAKQSLHFYGSSPNSSASDKKMSQQKQGKGDIALNVTPGSLNNSAGDSNPGPHSTFRVGVTEDKNKKCRRTMEDTHAYLYNFLSTPAPSHGPDSYTRSRNLTNDPHQSGSKTQPVETDNGYFAIFDGHAGNFAADWCGKKLHVLLEENIRKQPSTPIPELLDQTFTSVDQQLEKLPVKNSGCTAVIAVLRWEDRVPNSHSVTGSSSIAPAIAAATKMTSDPTSAPGPAIETAETDGSHGDNGDSPTQNATCSSDNPEIRLRDAATHQRLLYTANVGDARIVLCRNGKALRLSYDHKGSDENEGKRVANAGGLILNNRVNGVLAVTRALGDSYMKDLVTGHPYTTETVIQPEQDEFLILACDGVCVLLVISEDKSVSANLSNSSGTFVPTKKQSIWCVKPMIHKLLQKY